jgi:DNA (cytosine-5)-methyltransferase 1
MNYLSVCSGVEAATVAWHHMGWKAAGFSEIEKFPSEVLAHHYPAVTNFGDMTKYKEWKLDDPIGLLVGGTPCQSFSVAGLRKGLNDPRGNLALTYLGILDRFRPKWCVWENVPGVLSSGGGRDFGSFLGALAELGYGWAYRVLDAQNFGVAQRRRRVFVVGCFGNWRPAAEVLFESESLSGDTEQSRKTRKGITSYVESSFGQYREDVISGTIKASGGVAAGGSETFITHCVETFPTLLSSTAGVSRPGNEATEHQTYVAFGWQNSACQSMSVDTITPTLDKSKTPAVACPMAFTSKGNGDCFESSVHPTLSASGGGQPGQGYPAVREGMAVRRLTPVECERLQGFPDNYTNIKDKCPDGPRYKAMGNSMAVPVMRWIGERINMVNNEQ